MATTAEPRCSGDEDAARALIAQATASLDGPRREMLAVFAALLFGDADPEDVVGYDATELSALAAAAWDFISEPREAGPNIRFVLPPKASGERLRSIAVIEIVNDNMPFLVDSVMGALTERGLHVRLLAHPVISVERDRAGRLVMLEPVRDGGRQESFIHIHLDRVEDEAQRAAIVQALGQVLADVRTCVADWKPMLARLNQAIDELRSNPPPVPSDDVAEAVAFLEWIAADNFTLFGVSDYAFAGADRDFAPVAGTGFGLLRDGSAPVLRRAGQALHITPEIRAFFEEPKTLIVTKANIRSRVHRRVHLDYIGVKRFDRAGRPCGEFRVIGLFTSTAYNRSVRNIPYLRRKVEATLNRAGFDPRGHSGKALVNVLETYPRDELFQIDEDSLFRFALAILQLEARPRVRVLSRRDRFDRFVSLLVYVPRERFNSVVRARVGEYLARVYHGRVSAFYPFFPDGPLTRIHYIIGRDAGDTPDPDRATLEAAVGAIVRTWTDAFVDALAVANPPARAQELFERYVTAFSDAYREAFAPADAVDDIRTIEGLNAERPLAVSFYERLRDDSRAIGLKVWSHSRPIPLSERVPVLENMGFRVVDERTYEVSSADRAHGAWLHDMTLLPADGRDLDIGAAAGRLQACFLVIMAGGAENDGYNALVLDAALHWREVALIRAISRFLRQIRVPYSQDYMWTTLRRHAELAAAIVRLFSARFDPRDPVSASERMQREDAIVAEIEAALGAVESLDEDRIVRHFVSAVQAAVRTSFYQLDESGRPRAIIAIKFDSRRIDALPLPRPLYEIFVYSPRVEGVHLRFGKVARGGIRWSDRPQDFRTEVLGLVKAQQVKNAVIVPVGAKGGFVPKWLPSGGPRDAIQAEGVAAYKLFIGALLDVTDNHAAEAIATPADTVRHDGDDPYLVVAADKGTATFSDIANAISVERGFWLGDAFASGGSAGYDHKAMGITARGAWEAVKRHFREADVDITSTPFTVVGVGDMSGDVFGNGMLRERTTRLIAAFDHRDIFIDPDPDPEQSFEERARLFALARSSWQDYDKALISKGGGIFPRTSKEIVLSPQAQAALDLPQGRATPQEVMKAILSAPVDLLFFGGIGTYVRASGETDESVGDRANDPIRVKGSQLRCKVIGEGANLGMTQLGRVEAALAGVRLNTDAIDNSAGVNTSDVEVNIKIALSLPVGAGDLSVEARNALLADMTDDVAGLVLRNNYLQTLSLSLAARRGLEDLGFQQRLMQILEHRDELDRKVEFLPDDAELAERVRRRQPLTRPELAVLLAYAKLSLYAELLDSPVPDDPYLGRELARYFPAVLAQEYPDALERHRLRREIIATQLANSMINRGGPSLVVRIADQTGAAAAGIAAAFAAVRDSYGMPALNEAIGGLDGRVKGALQLELYAAVQELLLDRVVWFLRMVDLDRGLAEVVAHFRSGIEAVEVAAEQALPSQAQTARATRIEELTDAGLPEALASRFAGMAALAAAPDIVTVADRCGKPIADVTAIYFAVEAHFQLDRIVADARSIAVADYFDRLALDRALDAIGDALRRLTAAMAATEVPGAAAIEAWIEPRRAQVARVQAAIHEIAGSGLTLSKLAVAASLLGDLARD